MSAWHLLIERIDYHHGKWYQRDVDDSWIDVPATRIFELFRTIAPDEDQGALVKLFMYRDRDARALVRK